MRFCLVTWPCAASETEQMNFLGCLKYDYNIARALVLSKSYWAIMNKIFMYARPCSIKWRVQWRVQFHFSCKISVEFTCKFLCLSFGNVKIILNNPNLTSSLWLFPGKYVYFNVSVLTSLVFIFIEYLYCVWRVFGYVFILILSLIRRSEFFTDDDFRDQVKCFRSTVG